MAITFKVSPVDRATVAMRPSHGSTALPTLLDAPVEAWGSSASSSLPAGRNALLGTLHAAFADHYPLVLTPDAIWLCIAQGFAVHVNANAELLRGKFVRHQGKATIQIRRDDFVKGSPENPWPEVFPAFSDAIAEHIGRQRELVVCDFSTTGPCERAASEVVLMAAMQSYFSYEFVTRCGIPEITLEGTVDDWRSIRRRAQALGEYELEWWVAALMPVLDQLIAAAEGRVDVAFWRSLFKLNNESGGPYVTGWINVLFPYIEHRGTFSVNTFAADWSKGMSASFDGGPTESSFPAGLSVAPFLWLYLEERYPMEFLGGFIGMAQDAGTLALRPAIGWAVRDAAMAAQARAAEPPFSSSYPHGVLGEKEAALVAGRVSLGSTLTQDEAWRVAKRLEQVENEIGVCLECMVLGERPTASSFYVPARARLIIGVRLASLQAGARSSAVTVSLSHALKQVSGVPESVWTTLGALVPGGLSAESEVHLVSYYDDCKGMLVFGKPTDDTDGDNVHVAKSSGLAARRGVRGVKVAEVSSPGSPRALVDSSASAEKARLSAAQAIGVDADSAAYCLIVWTG